jgi:hypothetical protein
MRPLLARKQQGQRERTNDTRDEGATNSHSQEQEKHSRSHTGGMGSSVQEVWHGRTATGTSSYGTGGDSRSHEEISRLDFYTPGQQRDDHGRFGSGAGGALKATLICTPTARIADHRSEG